MNDFDLVRKNLLCKPLRTILLTVSVFMAFLVFGMLTSINEALNRAAEPSASAARLIVTNKINFTQSLPIAHLNQISTIPGVKYVTHQSWFASYYMDRYKNNLVGFYVDPETYLNVYGDDIRLTDQEKKNFISERTGVIVGKTLADLYGWRLGQTIPISSKVYSKRDGSHTWDMKITGIYTRAKLGESTAAFFFHYDYFNTTRTFGQDTIDNIVVRSVSPDLNDSIARKIDAMFANSMAETSTVDENTFARAFIKQAGDLNLIVTMVVAAAFVSILMMVSTTLISAIRERTKDIGIMKTIGFTGPRILRMVLGEAVLLSTIGAGLGLGASALILEGLSKSPAGAQFGDLSMAPMIAFTGLLMAITLGLVTGAIPAVMALHMSIVDALDHS